MARTLKDARLDTRAARQRLKQRREPYWRSLSEGLAIGYRKGAKGGTWIARHYTPEHGRRFQSIGTADDVLDADGVHVLSSDQAQTKAREWFADLARQDRGEEDDKPAAPYTVNNACDDYLAYLESDGRPDAAKDARYRIDAFIRPAFGTLEVAALEPQQLRKWRSNITKAAPRVRTRKGETQKHRDGAADERARKATANRILTVLKAALNHAFDEEKAPSNKAWGRRVKPFENVEGARVRFLQIAEAVRLINACETDFRRMVQAALQSGARYSELARLKVEDFDHDAGTIHIRESKSGKERHIVLTDEGVTFFTSVCAGKAGNEIMLPKADGSTWGHSHQERPIKEASKHAKIAPAATFHILRHTWASHAVMAGMPLLVVAKNLGHRDTRMVELHYGHLAPSYVTDEVRAKAPRFGFKPDNVVASIDDKRATA